MPAFCRGGADLTRLEALLRVAGGGTPQSRLAAVADRVQAAMERVEAERAKSYCSTCILAAPDPGRSDRLRDLYRELTEWPRDGETITQWVADTMKECAIVRSKVPEGAQPKSGAPCYHIRVDQELLTIMRELRAMKIDPDNPDDVRRLDDWMARDDENKTTTSAMTARGDAGRPARKKGDRP